MRERLVLVCFPSSTEHLVHRPMSAPDCVAGLDSPTEVVSFGGLHADIFGFA